MSKVKEVKYDPKGFTVVDTVEVERQKHRELPNSNPGTDDQWSYQDQPWQEKSDD